MAHGRKVGRFKLKIPSPETEKKYLFRWRSGDLYQHQESFPRLSRPGLFNSTGALNLEIGCGTGEYLIDLAVTNAEEAYLGVDASSRAIFFAVDLAANQSVDNIKFIQADARFLYPLLEPNSLGQVFFHFPDPNYGGKNRKLRIFDQTFLDQMYTALTPEGTLSVVTDEEVRFYEMLNLAEADLRFHKIHNERYLDQFDPQVESRFHRAWKRFEKPIFRFIVKKTIVQRQHQDPSN